MRVDAGFIGLVFSGVSTLVVVVGALAALWQLRHIRHGNELATLTHMEARFESREMREALTFVGTELAQAMHDPTFIAELHASPAGPRALHVSRVANFFEMLAIYVHFGALSERMTITIWGSVAGHYWNLLRDAIATARLQNDPVLYFFEDFAVRSERWLRNPRFRTERRRLLRDPACPASAGDEGNPVTPP